MARDGRGRRSLPAAAGAEARGATGRAGASSRSAGRAMIAADLDDVQVWVATTPVDMRKSFDGLAEVVRSFLGRDPLSGSLFVFRNKGGHLVKIDRHGPPLDSRH